mmetsp:Transcript_85588/g.242684  ORF Transcript_85588/g.242684 Transcript_85588/m.242684 type:complete len:208 (+) Transcript_85588:199-822(+)
MPHAHNQILRQMPVPYITCHAALINILHGLQAWAALHQPVSQASSPMPPRGMHPALPDHTTAQLPRKAVQEEAAVVQPSTLRRRASRSRRRSCTAPPDRPELVRDLQLPRLRAPGAVSVGPAGPRLHAGARGRASAGRPDPHVQLTMLLLRLLPLLWRPAHLAVAHALVDDAAQPFDRPLALDPELVHLPEQLLVLHPKPLLAGTKV